MIAARTSRQAYLISLTSISKLWHHLSAASQHLVNSKTPILPRADVIPNHAENQDTFDPSPARTYDPRPTFSGDAASASSEPFPASGVYAQNPLPAIPAAQGEERVAGMRNLFADES